MLLITTLQACTSLLIVITPRTAEAQTLQSHAPIFITYVPGAGTENFTFAGGVRSGTGNPDNPYIISDWEITTNSSSGIHIKNTHSFFVITNVIVHNTNSTGGIEGIYLDNVQNGR